jgi:quercetin dioxygenase-like cupin family protein
MTAMSRSKEDEMTETVEGIRHTSAGGAHANRQMDASVVAHLATTDMTGGRYSLFEVRDEPGGGPPMHRHTREDEAFYVLEGEYDVYSEDGPVLRATPGTYVHVSAGTAQAYRCVGPGEGRMLGIASPGGLERFFDALAATPPDPAQVAAVAERFGIEVVGPPRS